MRRTGWRQLGESRGDAGASLGGSQEDRPTIGAELPSNPAVAFLRPAAGKLNSSGVLSDIAGAARNDR
jgi:hypothetical protein